MSEVLDDKIRIYVRYRKFDKDSGEVKHAVWLNGRLDTNDKWSYSLRAHWSTALDWVERYEGDRAKAMDMARKLAQIVKCGKRKLQDGYVYDLYMVRDVTRRTEVSLTDNPMVVIAVAAMGD